MPRQTISLSSTIGPVDAGMIPALEEAYMEKYPNVVIRHIKAGTGATIETAKTNDIVDLVIVHAKSLEEQFVADGWGTERIPLMYNDYVLMGPADDPAGVKGMTDITEALEAIQDSKSHFISRGDNSGTNVKEKELWTAAGITPSGDWYEIYEKGASGNGPTLMYTDAEDSYTVMDRATYLTKKDSLQNIEILVEKDERMLNFINIIPCNPEKMPKVDAEGAEQFINWLVSDEAQEIIANFGVEEYGEPLFFPNAGSDVY
ncbi:MAG: tungsten ABC transporter permease [Methanocorpusculum parvum]|nr:tungsten ABC transporter permease [Methanocorpusculum parvum]